MGLVKYGLAIGLGYLLGRPEGRAQLQKVGQQAVELSRHPEVERLKEQGKSVAAEKVDAVKQKVVTRTADSATTPDGAAEPTARRRFALPTQRPRFGRSRNAHFPASEGISTPTSLGGTTVMEDSEAAVLGRPAVPGSDSVTSTSDGS